MRRLKTGLWSIIVLIVGALACNAPTDLPLPSFLATATATFTPTPTPTSTPTSTLTPTSTPTPTPTPTVTPPPTFSLDERLTDAAQAVQEGDSEIAAKAYHSLLALSFDAQNENVAAQAQFGLGITYLRDEDYASAVAAFRDFLAIYPEHDLTHDAHFLLADALVDAGEPLSATREYLAYLSAGTVITPYVNEQLGDAFYTGGAYTDAVDAYTAAIAAAPDRSFEVGMRERLALVHVALQDYDAAVAQYDAILDVAQVRAYRARIGHQAAETLVLAGETDAGYDRHLTIVSTYPDEYYAYLSLVELVNAGRPPDDWLRGVVDYYGEAYGPAVDAFYRHINAYPETYNSDAHWYVGLSYLRVDSPYMAAAEFQVLIDDYPENRHWGDSWMGLAEAYVDTGDIGAAIGTYEEFVEVASDHPRAPESLWEAAQLLERDGDLQTAAEAYLDCHVRYPDSDYGSQALFRSGLQSYQLDELVDAAAAWNTLLDVYPNSPYRLTTLLWLGKLGLVQGDGEAAATAFEEVVTADPFGYYGLRAADLIADPLSAPFPPTRYEPDYDAAAGQAETEEWLAGWLVIENMGHLGEPGPDLASDPRLQRGLELWRLGHFVDAKWELEAVRNATRSDALAQYQLALLFRDIRLYRSSILCAVRVISLSPTIGFLDAPPFIARLAYPTYYEDLALENARLSDFDPLLVFALIRQESLFESLAASWASARGLMQVIPPTGEEIHANLGWPPGYETADLYRPYVSLRFGTYYLAEQRNRFDGRIDVALAAYNGGPFRAIHWLESAGDDSDLFLELVTLHEPRIYIQRIKEHLVVYQALYGK
ncbi:MAG: tetratricopeptide repeat protein [Chloroflexi bacterium]|nr:tetratricopeptide repeat protein [Chloroflexota bacterium]